MDKYYPYGEIIRSKENPKIKLYKKLVGSKKERYAYKLFVLEGSRLISDALDSGAAIRQIYLAESSAEKYLQSFENIGNDIKINIVSDEIGRYVSATENTQGIFAQCSFSDNTKASGKLRKGGKYAVLYKLQDPGNVGMIIRTADALGLDGVILCGSCDIYNPKTVRATMGSMFRIPVFSDIEEDDLFTALDAAHIRSCAAVVGGDAHDVKSVGLGGFGAVFIGNEGNGLESGVIDKCSDKITIKMSGNAESLNAAMAAGIIMWELMRCE
ncbi:MAG: RNA methyltransferase [Clostridium sp.]|nr:RNA methyltransferase [Clostridium sp.]MCM1547224.1 RNA methyltransferase [Ruminococcus sp.]